MVEMFIVKRKTYRSVPRLSGTYLLFSFLPNVSQEIVEICTATFLGRQKHCHFTLMFEKGRKAGVPYPTAPADLYHMYPI